MAPACLRNIIYKIIRISLLMHKHVGFHAVEDIFITLYQFRYFIWTCKLTVAVKEMHWSETWWSRSMKQQKVEILSRLKTVCENCTWVNVLSHWLKHRVLFICVQQCYMILLSHDLLNSWAFLLCATLYLCIFHYILEVNILLFYITDSYSY